MFAYKENKKEKPKKNKKNKLNPSPQDETNDPTY